MKRTKLTNQDKRNIANALWEQIETITIGIEERSGYYKDLEDLDPIAVRLQLEKWISRLPK